MKALLGLGRPALLGLADALRAGRVAAPYTRAALAGLVPSELADVVAAALAEVTADGMAPRHVARALDLLAAERAAVQRRADAVELVWSPSELDRVDCRDTAVVVQDLFRRATKSVLVVTYVLDQGDKADAIFGALAARMDAEPALAVRVVANVQRTYGDETPAAEIVRAFARRLRDKVWPGARLPEVFYDPRALSLEDGARASMHAKLVVVDERLVLVTSANFTEAAQLRNIEAGVVIDDPHLGARVALQIARLVEARELVRLPTG